MKPMHLDKLRGSFRRRFPAPITTVDSHTCGEATRLIVGGTGPLGGRTMKDKRRYFINELDHVRKLLTREPRGHRDLLAAALTDPVSSDADFGLIYMDARRYPHLCGHATIGAVATLLDLGELKAEQGRLTVIVDTPSGPMTCNAVQAPGQATAVTIGMVPSFVHSLGERVDVPELGSIEVDTVCVGGFFAMVDVTKAGIDLDGDRHELIALGMRIIAEADRQLTVSHPERAEVASIDVVEFHDGSANIPGAGMVVYGESHMDRCPCGTGTAAKMTLLHRKGEFAYGDNFINAGPLGSTFAGRIIGETLVGGIPAVRTEVTGSAVITGMQDFVLDPADPFPEGYLL